MIYQTIRVALIEDSATDAALVRESLLKRSNGTAFHVEHFTTLGSGVERLRATHFDVLLLDLDLPDSRGIHTLTDVATVVPRLPILVLAGADVAANTLEIIADQGRSSLSKSIMSADTLADAVLREAMAAMPDSADIILDTPVRVLVVEDDHRDLAVIRYLLASVRSMVLDVKHASTLSTALERLSEGIDVVLLDLTLPDSQGLATLHGVRSQHPSIPVVTLLFPADGAMAVEVLRNEAQDYMFKGRVDSDLLGKTIRRLARPAAHSKISKPIREPSPPPI